MVTHTQDAPPLLMFNSGEKVCLFLFLGGCGLFLCFFTSLKYTNFIDSLFVNIKANKVSNQGNPVSPRVRQRAENLLSNKATSCQVKEGVFVLRVTMQRGRRRRRHHLARSRGLCASAQVPRVHRGHETGAAEGQVSRMSGVDDACFVRMIHKCFAGATFALPAARYFCASNLRSASPN